MRWFATSKIVIMLSSRRKSAKAATVAPSCGHVENCSMAEMNLPSGCKRLRVENNADTKCENSKQVRKYARRLAVSHFVGGLETQNEHPVCCEAEFNHEQDLYRHINSIHSQQINSETERILVEGSLDAKWKVLQRKDISVPASEHGNHEPTLPHMFSAEDEFLWLPIVREEDIKSKDESRQILLFYKYRNIIDTNHVKEWQEALCKRLNLTGKVRIAKEGLNGTVAGTVAATQTYMAAVMKHPLFSDMIHEQFKTSIGGADCFPDGLRVGVYGEAVPMGIKPEEVSFEDAGVHLSPTEFHQAMDKFVTKERKSEAVLIDCRNFYESKIGRFEGAVAPDIRKFSYWPEYVDHNPEVFRNKDVYMYCTGGIRCERGSAYLKRQGLCREVYQLDGGIHKYMEKYPDGFFKGKLFVFDNRYAIPVNDTILSECVYCHKPWDDYQPCSSSHCHQLVLSCTDCRQEKLTACCATCQQNHELNTPLEECSCTKKRERVATETPSGAKGDRI